MIEGHQKDMGQMYIKSKIKKGKVQWSVYILVFSIINILFLIKIGILFFNDQSFVLLSGILVLLLFITISILALKDLKAIQLSKKGKIYFKSIIFPFGKVIDINKFKYKTILSEISAEGEHKVSYLINKKGYAIFKINGQFYENFNDLYDNINLKEIQYNANFKNYFKLLFFGKAKIINEKQNTTVRIINPQKIISILIFAGMVLFFFMIIIKLFSHI